MDPYPHYWEGYGLSYRHTNTPGTHVALLTDCTFIMAY